MQRPSYLNKYVFDWELFDVVIGGRSTLDSKFFVGPTMNREQVYDFLKGYGMDATDPINKAELYGIFQEAVQFIRHHFLREGNPDGLEINIPQSLYTITDVADLFLLATNSVKNRGSLERLWAEIILKVMHTILHVDKDLRHNYFPVIQTQIFDKFYRYIYRDEQNRLFLGAKGTSDQIPLFDFQTKAKKPRDSIIIKLLNKAENVAEELFDRVGMRLITFTPFDSLRVIKFLVQKNIFVPHNLKPSRSFNTLIDLPKFQKRYHQILKKALRENLNEEQFLMAMENESFICVTGGEHISERNLERSKWYRSIQFTGRALITYRDPFLQEFNKIRQLAKNVGDDNEIARRILALNAGQVARDVRFFYPFEVQITDRERHLTNTEGEASHQAYKKNKLKQAMKRVFWALLKTLSIEID
ncbi:MAG: TIGR04552 family protein [Pseudomonadota bacterium]